MDSTDHYQMASSQSRTESPAETLTDINILHESSAYIYPTNFETLDQWQEYSALEDSVVDLAWDQFRGYDKTGLGLMDWWQFALPRLSTPSPPLPISAPFTGIILGNGATPRDRARGLEAQDLSLQTVSLDVEKPRAPKRATRQHTRLHPPTNTIMDSSLSSASSPDANVISDGVPQDSEYVMPESLDARSPFRLRRASQVSKRYTDTTLRKYADSKTEPSSRKAHNRVEKRYRGRLNMQFENLLSLLSNSGAEWEGKAGDFHLGSGKTVSKAETLAWAVRRIKRLEAQSSEERK